ncbi:MAG: fatty acid desaturase [Pseudomonadales bacterium]|nr:fatty acid desaturase [Pseudomonadales bacterium]
MQFSNNGDIRWYRSPIDKLKLNRLMQRNNLKGWRQTLLHLGWFATTATIALSVFNLINVSNAIWSVPLLMAALFLHGTMGPFMGLIAVHELQHRTVFKSRKLNEFFERIYAFISWSDYIWYQQSHTLHHMATCHAAHDGEVIMPVRFSLRRVRTWLGLLAWDPSVTLNRWQLTWRHARGDIRGDWYNHVLPATANKLRRRHRNWARILLIGHGSLALLFILTGNWFLLVVFTIGTQYCSWLGFLCGITQHYGLNPDLPDFRQNTRTFTCSWLPAFYYWNMQYHLEHHMYPAVPCYNLAKLRSAIKDDLPIATHGLAATWREILSIKEKSMADPSYRFSPSFPASAKQI